VTTDGEREIASTVTELLRLDAPVTPTQVQDWALAGLVPFERTGTGRTHVRRYGERAFDQAVEVAQLIVCEGWSKAESALILFTRKRAVTEPAIRAAYAAYFRTSNDLALEWLDVLLGPESGDAIEHDLGRRLVADFDNAAEEISGQSWTARLRASEATIASDESGRITRSRRRERREPAHKVMRSALAALLAAMVGQPEQVSEEAFDELRLAAGFVMLGATFDTNVFGPPIRDVADLADEVPLDDLRLAVTQCRAIHEMLGFDERVHHARVSRGRHSPEAHLDLFAALAAPYLVASPVPSRVFDAFMSDMGVRLRSVAIAEGPAEALTQGFEELSR
jgi:hypothetical protein